MPRKRRPSSPFDPFDDDFDEDASSQGSRNGNPPIQRNAANARERARMRVLSSAFGRLKTKLPNIPPDTKLSKLDTLRLATMYIKQLKTIVEGGTPSGENFDAGLILEQGGLFNLQNGSQSMTWPFGFHHIQSSSRQLQFQYSTMDWTHSQEAYSNKLPATRRDNDAFPQLNSNSNQQEQWYNMETNSSADANRAASACAYEALLQQDQGQRLMQTQNSQTHLHSQHAPLSLIHPHHQQHQQQHHHHQQQQQHNQQTSIR